MERNQLWSNKKNAENNNVQEYTSRREKMKWNCSDVARKKCFGCQPVIRWPKFTVIDNVPHPHRPHIPWCGFASSFFRLDFLHFDLVLYIFRSRRLVFYSSRYMCRYYLCISPKKNAQTKPVFRRSVINVCRFCSVLCWCFSRVFFVGSILSTAISHFRKQSALLHFSLSLSLFCFWHFWYKKFSILPVGSPYGIVDCPFSLFTA